MSSVFEECYSSPVIGHHSSIRISHKILQCGYYWPTIHQYAHEFAKSCYKCQRVGGTKKQELPLNRILVIEFVDVWGIDFMGPFMISQGMNYILVAVDYMSKWVEVIVFSNNEGKSVIALFKKNIFSSFGTPTAIISDGGSHFCNRLFKGY